MPVIGSDSEILKQYLGSKQIGQIIFGNDIVQYGTPNFTLSYLVVGGGGGGAANNGGGGGAGGFDSGSYVVWQNGSYGVAIGEGGSGGISATGTTGSNGETSYFDGITSIGGGGGGTGALNGLDGASGGGSGTTGSPGTGSTGGNGGDGLTVSFYDPAGGGGGAAANGEDATQDNIPPNFERYAGDGGAGYLSDITGTSTEYAGGGGGGIQDSARADSTLGFTGSGAFGGGNGGQGQDPFISAQTGSVNTGGGGGGAGGNANGANGGSGVVILRYTGSYQAVVSGSLTHTSSSVGGDTVLELTSGSGVVSWIF